MSTAEHMSLAEAKSHLSEVVENVENEHSRVVITKHGRPAAVLMSAEDLEALEETLDILSDADARTGLQGAASDEQQGEVEYLSKDDAIQRWVK